MSPDQQTQRQSTNVQTPKSCQSSLLRRLRSQIHYWTSSMPNGSKEGSHKDLDPQSLEAGFNQQSMPESGIQDSQEIEDSCSTASNWTTFQEEKADNGADCPNYAPPNDSGVNSAQKEEGQSYDNNVASRTAAPSTQQLPEYTHEARHLIQSFTIGHHNIVSGEPRPDARTSDFEEYPSGSEDILPPENYKPSIFGALLTSRLKDLQHESVQWRNHLTSHTNNGKEVTRKSKHLRSRSDETTAPASGMSTPSPKPKWYEKTEHDKSMVSLLVQAGISSSSPGLPSALSSLPQKHTPPLHSSSLISTAVDMIRHGTKPGKHTSGHLDNRKSDIVAEVADILACRTYLTKLCGALMRYGAPTHRVEQYLAASARALLIDAQFMYIPGAMMCTFIDNTIRANSVELVRTQEGLDFGRLKDVFDVYKCVIHEKYTAEEGILEIDNIQKRNDPYGVWFRIFVFGMASVFVGPFSFNSRPIDFVPTFILGSAIGCLQLKVVPRSEQFSNVFEVFACVMAAFIARGLGSIRWSSGQYVFCFAATAQSSIAMILPGFLVLNSALELQGRSMVSGSVRMVYSIIYVLFLGFGLLVGTTAFGLLKRDATEDVTCQVPDWFSAAEDNWKLIYTRFIWVPLYACCVAIIYRAKLQQLPVMALIAVCGHQANYWISTQLSSNLQVANAVGAFVIGCMAHLYSRLFHGLAAASMLPAIYCQVPGGLAASGSLVAGINSSNQMLGNSSSVSVINNGTQGFVAAQNDPSTVYGGTIFNIGYGMVQVAIGISVGLYLSALVVYPYGKRRSGLFSF